MSKRAEMRRQTKKSEKSEKHFWVTQAQLEELVTSEVKKMITEENFKSNERLTRLYSACVSASLRAEGWGWRGARMQRFFNRVDAMLHELSRRIQRGNKEAIIAYCEEVGIDYEDAFGIKPEQTKGAIEIEEDQVVLYEE